MSGSFPLHSQIARPSEESKLGQDDRLWADEPGFKLEALHVSTAYLPLCVISGCTVCSL